MRLLNRVMSDHSACLGSKLKYLGALLSLFAVITAGCAMIKLREEVSESVNLEVHFNTSFSVQNCFKRSWKRSICDCIDRLPNIF